MCSRGRTFSVVYLEFVLVELDVICQDKKFNLCSSEVHRPLIHWYHMQSKPHSFVTLSPALSVQLIQFAL